MKTPTQIIDRANDYKNNAWENYSIEELGNWVHLFVKRAGQRTQPEKIQKDLTDAQNYLAMMQAHIDHAVQTLIGS